MRDRIVFSRRCIRLASVLFFLLSFVTIAAAMPPSDVLPGSIANPDGSYTLLYRPAAGANDGTDQGSIGAGKDAGVFSVYPGSGQNYGTAPRVHTFNSDCNEFHARSFFQWDVSTLPAAASVVRVKANFYHYIYRSYGWPYQINPTTMIVQVPTEPWQENTLTWNNQPSLGPTEWGRVDIPTPPISAVIFDGPVSVDITELYRKWRSGDMPNYGMAYSRLQMFCENANASLVSTSDEPADASPDRRPYLEITYTVDPPVPTGGYGTVNLAKNKPLTALTNTVRGNAAMVNDGDVDMAFQQIWCSYQGSPSTNAFVLDLGARYRIGRYDLWPLQVHGFSIATSDDGVNYTQRHTNAWGAAGVMQPFSVAPDGAYYARYIRYSAYANWPQYVGMAEFRVYEWLDSPSTSPPGTLGSVNLALNKPVTGLTELPAANPPSFAVDGNANTIALGSSSPGRPDDSNGKWTVWGGVRIDLGGLYPIGKIVVDPEVAQSYVFLLTQTDAANSGPAWYVDASPAMFGTGSAMSQPHTFTINGEATARYVWLLFSNVAPTLMLPGIAEIEVYGWSGDNPRVQTSTTLTSSANPSTYGDSVTFAAAVSAASGSAVPSGSIQFKLDGSDFGVPVPLVNGAAMSGAISSLPAGNYRVAAFYSGDAGFFASSGDLVQAVAKANQSIAFGPLNGKAYGDPDFSVSATASSGLPVGFLAFGACTVAANVVHLTGIGSCTITAFQGGNANYSAAPEVSQSFAVIITYDGLSRLVSQFVTKAGVANSMLAKLDNARKAEARGDLNARAGMINAFINEVQAQTNKAVSAENAAILIALAKSL